MQFIFLVGNHKAHLLLESYGLYTFQLQNNTCIVYFFFSDSSSSLLKYFIFMLVILLYMRGTKID